MLNTGPSAHISLSLCLSLSHTHFLYPQAGIYTVADAIIVSDQYCHVLNPKQRPEHYKRLITSHILLVQFPIKWAVDEQQVDIINMSLGTETSYDTIKDAVDYADSKGVLLIASAG
jgi:Subtilase family